MDNGNDDDDMDSDMDDDEAGDTYDVVDAVGRVEGAVSRVESAVARVEHAVKEKWSWIGWMLIMVLLWNVPGDIWHAKWRYAVSYGVGSDKVIVDKRPHDCAFFKRPSEFLCNLYGV